MFFSIHISASVFLLSSCQLLSSLRLQNRFFSQPCGQGQYKSCSACQGFHFGHLHTSPLTSQLSHISNQLLKVELTHLISFPCLVWQTLCFELHSLLELLLESEVRIRQQSFAESTQGITRSCLKPKLLIFQSRSKPHNPTPEEFYFSCAYTSSHLLVVFNQKA